MPRSIHYDSLLELLERAAGGSQLVAEHEFELLGGLALKGLSKRVRASALAGEGPASRAQLPASAMAV